MHLNSQLQGLLKPGFTVLCLCKMVVVPKKEVNIIRMKNTSWFFLWKGG